MLLKSPLSPDDPLPQKKSDWSQRISHQLIQDVVPIQLELPADCNTRTNLGLPLPPTAERLNPALLSPQEDPEAEYMTAITRRTYRHIPHTLLAADRRTYNKHAKAQEAKLRVPGAVEPNPYYFKVLTHPHPRLPQDIEEQCKEQYPSLHPDLAKILFLRDKRTWQYNSIAFRMNSSPQQIEQYYFRASLLNLFTERSEQLKLSSKA